MKYPTSSSIYRTMKSQQYVLTLEAVKKFKEQNKIRKCELEKQLGISLSPGEKINIEMLLTFHKESENRRKLLDYLNLYESVARTIRAKIYDEEIFKRTINSDAIITFHLFQDFIYEYRKRYNHPYEWEQFEKMITKWERS